MFVNSLGPGLPPLWSPFPCGDPLNLSTATPLSAFRHTTHVMTSPDPRARRSPTTVNKPLALRGGSTPTARPAALLALQSLQVQQQKHNLTELYLSNDGAGGVGGGVLYPSIIHLPGTLPQSPGAASTGGDSPGGSPRSSDLGSPEERTRVNPPRPGGVASKELKFGIDRILIGSKDNDQTHGRADDQADPAEVREPSPRRAEVPYREPPAPSLGIPCHCGTLPCPLVFTALPYPGHVGPGYPPHHPPPLHGFRPSDFQAGPYTLLAAQEKLSGRHLGHPGHTQPKRKRSWSRAVFSNLQRKGLEKRFEVQKYVTKPDRRQLAAMLGLTDAQVKVWFQNRRMKWRHLEEARKKKDDEPTQNKDVIGSPKPETTDTLRDVTDDLLADDDSDIDVDDGFLVPTRSDITAGSDDKEIENTTGKEIVRQDSKTEYSLHKEHIAKSDTGKLDHGNVSMVADLTTA